MRPEAIKNILKAFHSIHRPMLIQGPPGGGKTQVVQQVAREMRVGFIHMHAPTMQPEDFAILAPNADRTAIEFLINSRFPVEGSDHPDEGFILIDEAPQGDNSIQKTTANLVQEREIYGKKLKAGWTIVLTGNRQSDRAGANRILSHLRNRLTTVDYDASVDDWFNWAIDNDIRPELIAFIKFRPDQLNAFDPQQEISPTPRAWSEGVSPILDKVPHEVEFDCIKGAVGEGAASEFMAFLKIFRKLPSVESVLAAPDTFPVPEDTSVRYALSSALAHRATQENFEKVLTFARRMPTEFSTLVVLSSVRRHKELQQTRIFIDWISKEGKSVLI